MNRIAPIATLCLVVVAAAGCGKPIHDLRAPSDGEAMIDSVAGTTIEAEVDVWAGSLELLSRVTPVRVTIRNDSGRPVVLRYDYFELVTDDGRVYEALQPFEISGASERPVVVYPPIDQPEFYWDRFRVAPYFAGLYPGMGVYDGYYGYTPLHREAYHRMWRTREVPSRTMIRRALPEGVIDSGGQVSGFLYFEQVDRDSERAVLRADIVPEGTGQRAGTARIKFRVSG